MTAGGTLQRPRRRWVWCLVALVTATVFAVPFRLRIFVPHGTQHAAVSPVSYNRGVSDLQVQANGGAVVTIRAGRPGRVTVGGSISWTFGRPVVTEHWRGRSLQVGATCPKLDPFGGCQVTVVLTVPAATAVQAQAGAGSVAVAGLSGPLHLSATSGSLMAENISGPVWASVTSGSLVANNGLTSQRFYASVTSGQITLGFRAPPRILATAVGAGEAQITLPARSRYRITSSAGAGDLSVAPGLSDARSDLVLTVTIGTGVASIGYPAPGSS
jgi:hypothetical protein